MRFLVCIILFLTSLATRGQGVDPDDAFRKGMDAWQSRDYETAREYFDLALHQDPGLTDAYLYRASTLDQLDKPELAVIDYMVYLNAHPEQVEVLLAVSTINYRLKRYETARTGFLKLLKLPAGETNMVYFRQPVNGEGVTSMFTAQSADRSFLYNYLGLTEQGLGNFSAALNYLDTAIHLQNHNPDYYVNRGSVYQQIGQPEKAEEDYRRALELRPEHGLARYNLAILLENSGDIEKAVSFYSRSIEDNPSSPYAYRQRGYRFMLDGELDKALADMNKALELDPDDPETLVNRGIVLSAKGSHERALDDFGKAIDLKPDFEKAYFNRGNTLYHLKRYQDALNDYDVSLIYNPDYGRAYYQRALVNYYLENADQACADIIKAETLGVSAATRARSRICLENRSQ